MTHPAWACSSCGSCPCPCCDTCTCTPPGLAPYETPEAAEEPWRYDLWWDDSVSLATRLAQWHVARYGVLA